MDSESPPSRSTILGSLLRGRPRNSSHSFAQVAEARELSPPPPAPSPAPLSSSARARRHNTAGGSAAGHVPSQLQPSTSQPQQQSTGLALTQMLRRRRSAGNVNNSNNNNNNSNNHNNRDQPQTQSNPHNNPTTQAALALAGFHQNMSSSNNQHQSSASATTSPPTTTSTTTPSSNPNNPAHRIRLVPHLDSRRSLRFDPIGRDLKEGDPALRIGRFTDRSGLGLSAINQLNSHKLAFRSKVVSRAHAEIWVEQGGKFYIRDTKSSSGTFLNHVRLSQANAESRPFQIKDGDILQLGVDYQGGAEDIYKSVKIRIEIGREWQSGANAFNTNAFKNLKALALPNGTIPTNSSALNTPATGNGGKVRSLGIPDCCICLFSITIRQALFIAPCSHTFHYKCMRSMLETHHPSFCCPLCRTYADLDEDVEVDEANWGTGPEIDADGNVLNPGGQQLTGVNDIDNGAAVENVLNAVGAVSGVAGGGGPGGLGGVSEGEEDDRMDVDQDNGGTGAITPNNEQTRSSPIQPLEIGSGEEDGDSDIGGGQGAINISTITNDVNNNINVNGNNPSGGSTSASVNDSLMMIQPPQSPLLPPTSIISPVIATGGGSGEDTEVGGIGSGVDGLEGDVGIIGSVKRKR